MTAPAHAEPPFAARLRRRRLAARAALGFERLWPALWPPLGVLGAYLCAALLDLPSMLPAALHLIVLVAVLAAAAWLLVRGLRHLRVPTEAEADRRLERASGLHHRPLAALVDRPALPGADGLWRAHVARAAAQIGRLRVGLPRPGLATIDRRALRGGLIVALAATLVVAGGEAPERVARAFVPHFAPTVPTPPAELQGWITPPAYTNLAPVFLRPEGGAIAVPAGSHLTISLSGGSGAPALTLGGAHLPFQQLDATSFQADRDLTAGGRLVVRRGGTELAAWDLTVLVDAAPVVRWPEPPGVARGGGRVPSTKLPWQVSHDYGVTALQAELRLRERPDAAPLIVTIPLPGGAPKQAKGVRVQDLTPHPWAGLPVIARLVARDAPGLVGTSADAMFILPERRFDNPTARAVIAVRKGLTLHPDRRAPAIAELDRLSELEPVWRNDPGGFINLQAAAADLLYNRADGAVAEVQARLWQLALHLEEGATDRTARALEQARRELRDALDAQRRGEKIDPKEIERRLQALEQAIAKHLQALTEQLRRDPDAQMADPNSAQIDPQEAQRLAEEMRQAIEQGRMEDAQKRMAELEKMLDQLQKARPMHRSAQARERAQKQARGRQQMNALQDMVQREGGLLDRAQARDSQPSPEDATPPSDAPPQGAQPQDEQSQNQQSQDQQSQNQQSQNQQSQEQQAQDKQAAARKRDARMQEALRRALGELMQQYGELMGKVPPNLGDADMAMRDAARSLNKGEDGAAAGEVQRAIEALQKGGQSMSEQMAQAFGAQGAQRDGEQQEGGQQSDQDGGGTALGDPRGGDGNSPGGRNNRPWQHGNGQFGRNGDRHTDPLGRPLQEGASGADESGDVTVPEQMERARTRAIQDELRRRAAERGRPQQELDYIDRLLKQF
ncbi:MAG: DUF4175 family protein [Alphaproteobacteria bacterium]|nr:DUF4175 family protein [Alphaproteobacteria bacterium]